MEIIIVAVRTLCQEEFWQKKLRQRATLLCSTQSIIIVVRQTCIGEAIKGLSAFLIYHRAQEKAKFLYQIDLYELQRQGAAVTLYCEGMVEETQILNSYPNTDIPYAFKLPAKIENESLTLLEAAIAQTEHNLSHREGRFTVIQVNNIYVLSIPHKEKHLHHIEIIKKKRTRSMKEWEVISFSIQMSFAIFQEFRKEIEQQNHAILESLDLLHPLKTDLILQRNPNRIQTFFIKFLKLHTEKYLFGNRFIENEGYIWDYRSLKAYYQSTLKVITTTPEGLMMRFFYNIRGNELLSTNNRVIKDESSLLINCNVRSGKIRNSVLVDVDAAFLNVQNCVIIGAKISSLQGKLFLLYHEKRYSNTFKFMMPGGIAHA